MPVRLAFDIRRLKPFHGQGDRIPSPAPEKADEVATLDPDLRREEQSYVSHYLGYADLLLKHSEEEGTTIRKNEARRRDRAGNNSEIGPNGNEKNPGTRRRKKKS
jgi:hypothetical protein